RVSPKSEWPWQLAHCRAPLPWPASSLGARPSASRRRQPSQAFPGPAARAGGPPPRRGVSSSSRSAAGAGGGGGGRGRERSSAAGSRAAAVAAAAGGAEREAAPTAGGAQSHRVTAPGKPLPPDPPPAGRAREEEGDRQLAASCIFAPFPALPSAPLLAPGLRACGGGWGPGRSGARAARGSPETGLGRRLWTRMSRHEGVSCDACLKGNFRGRRYKCLICYDYDLCATCYESGATTTRHTTDHPMQCILTRVDFGK
uniref:RING-type E3 ubiquitin transferase n=1 Tax=Calidris pygmaea TaxID=425635 RepID=A0A8C3J944_9CHAR